LPQALARLRKYGDALTGEIGMVLEKATNKYVLSGQQPAFRLTNSFLRHRQLWLFHSIETLLQDLPILQACGFGHRLAVDFCFESVFGRTLCFIEDAEIARERSTCQFVGGIFAGDIVVRGNRREDSAFARIGGVKRAFVKFDALAQALDNAEPIMVHRRFHHLEDVVGIGVSRPRNETGTGGNQLLHWIDRLINGPPDVRFALEANRRGWAGLLFGQAVNEIIHDDVCHLNIFTRCMIDVVAANRERIAIAAKGKNVKVRPTEGDTARERESAAMNVMGTVSLNEIGKSAGATNTGNGSDLFMMQTSLFEELVIEREHRKITAAGAPRGMVGGEFFFADRLASLGDTRTRGRGRGWSRIAGQFGNSADCHRNSIYEIAFVFTSSGR
jgi:hypothetical protein